MTNLTLTEAFIKHFTELSIDKFPSGDGNWRNELRYRSDEFIDGEKGADLFSSESLLELSSLQPFVKDISWSDDIKQLLNENIVLPLKRQDANILEKFRKLRFIGKDVERIDEDTKYFTNLQELILSANYISEIDGNHLPPSLKVFELCANKISNISSFVDNLPSLDYLGLSYNYITSIHQYLKPHSWINLLFLDLSYNFINDLENTITALKQLQKLKSLLLKGNPVYCLMGYRGILIDSLNKLSMLDDIGVTADDRLRHKGIYQLQDIHYNEFVLHFHLSKLKGLLPPEQQALTDEYLMNIVKYQIQIEFPVARFIEKDRDSFFNGAHKAGSMLHESENVVISMESELSAVSTVSSSSTSAYYLKSKEFSVMNNEEISLDYESYVIANNVTKLHEYLKHPINVEVIVHHIVVSNEPKLTGENSNTLGNELQSIGKEKSAKSVDRSKSKLSVSKMNSNETGGSNKSKPRGKTSKQEPIHLYEWSRTKKIFASCQINCEMLLEDFVPFHQECVFDVDDNIAKELSGSLASSGDQSSKLRSQEQKKRLSRDMKRGGGSAKSMLANKNKKSNDLTNKEISNVLEENSDFQLPVTLDLLLEVVRWNSVGDASDYLYGVVEEAE